MAIDRRATRPGNRTQVFANRAAESLPRASREAEILAALGSEHRLQVIELLREGGRCVCEITPAFNLDPSVVSRHLAQLEHAGLIASRRNGRRIYYRIADRRVLRILDAARRISEHPEQPDRWYRREALGDAHADPATE